MGKLDWSRASSRSRVHQDRMLPEAGCHLPESTIDTLSKMLTGAVPRDVARRTIKSIAGPRREQIWRQYERRREEIEALWAGTLPKEQFAQVIKRIPEPWRAEARQRYLSARRPP